MASVVPFVMPFLADTSGPFSQLLATEDTAQTAQAWIQDMKDVISTIKRQAIDQETPFDVICEDIKQLEGDISAFKRLLQSNEASRAHWRRVHMEIWRGTFRPLKVVDLPSEILTMVFGHFKHVPVVEFGYTCEEPPPISPDVGSLKSIRLACRAFCNAGSRFLLPVVNISFTQSSLQRLQDVSNHSQFSKGVRFIRIHANPYNSLIVSDRYQFVRATQERIRHTVLSFRKEEETFRREVAEMCRLEGVEVPSPSPYYTRAHELDEALKGAQKLLVTLRRLFKRTHIRGRQGPMTSSEDKIMKAIDETHEEYGRRYLEQRSLINDPQELSRIVTAVRKMPCIEGIIIPDAGDHRWWRAFLTGWDNRCDIEKFESNTTSTNPFWNFMIQEGDRENNMAKWDTCRPFPLLQKLPFILQATNENLTVLDVNLPPIYGHHMETSTDQLANLQRTCQKLKLVRIRVTDTPWTHDEHHQRNLATTYAVLDRMLVSPRLEAIYLS